MAFILSNLLGLQRDAIGIGIQIGMEKGINLEITENGKELGIIS